MTDQRIFLSYSHDEAPFVRSVAAELQRRGVDAGLQDEMRPGAAWLETVSQSLKTSSAVIVFVGHAVNSPSMNFEIGAALGQSLPVLAVFLTQEAQDEVPPLMNALTRIDASNLKPEEVADQIAAALSAVA